MTFENVDLNFSDLEPIEKEFTYQGKLYLLCEATADSVRKFNNGRSERIEFGPDGRVIRVRDVADLVFVLLSGNVLEKDSRKQVPEGTLRSWGSRVIDKLFSGIKLISGIDEGVTRQYRTLTELLAEKDCPIDRAVFVDWVEKLNKPEYKDLLRILKEPTVKE